MKNILMFMSHWLTSYSCMTLSTFQNAFVYVMFLALTPDHAVTVPASIFTVKETN